MEKTERMEKMRRFFTGDKNIDSIILTYLKDKDIFNICLTGKYGRELCSYEPFWYNRLETKFPYFLSVKPQSINFKDYYIYLISSITRIFFLGGIGNIKTINQNMLKSLSQEYKDKALMWASESGCLELVKYLVQNGAVTYDFSLDWASQNGHLETVKYLVQNGADIHARDSYGLRYASRNGHLEVVKYLVENGVNVHAVRDCSLSWASQSGHLEVVKYLVEKGANVHASYDSALTLAAERGHLEVVKYLKSLP